MGISARCWTNDVMRNLEGVVKRYEHAEPSTADPLTPSPPPPPPPPHPLPWMGEGAGSKSYVSAIKRPSKPCAAYARERILCSTAAMGTMIQKSKSSSSTRRGYRGARFGLETARARPHDLLILTQRMRIRTFIRYYRAGADSSRPNTFSSTARPRPPTACRTSHMSQP